MLDDIVKERRKKLELLKSKGIDPYPAHVPRTSSVAEALRDFEKLTKAEKEVSLAGRLRSMRDQGKIVFADIEDGSGKMQVVLKEDTLKDLEFWRSALDIGDFVSVTGPLFATKRGEKSIEARSLVMAAKSLLPLPDKWEGIEDAELRLRKRYLDLIATPELRELFRKKTVFWETLREFLKKEGFMEVETPVLQTLPGGADAEPFKTHHDALDTDVYLRIALELSLKKLLVGGFEKVFEIGRVFRNEGIDREHLQDFTFLEFYWAYAGYEELMPFVERMFQEAIRKTCGGLVTEHNGQKIDWSKKWEKVDYVEAFKRETGLDPLEASEKDLIKKAKELKLEPEKHFGKGRLVDLIYKKTVRPKLVQPCFLVDPPAEVVPLAKRLASDPRRVARMQPVACGTELGNGYTELNDPLDQRARFDEQMKLRKAGDKEAQPLDEDFLEAMEYGMPPATGFGMSERVFAVLMDKPVRECVFFPLMRPRK
ncbi:MAG TPA: lysine--tRNA ligase [Candidatus Paceibacterota bacterium]|jgi:lysyl-tRNA synthetase class 2|nr:lysine--tRNA ligase [Candidatus Paceibacterota bacterium]